MRLYKKIAFAGNERSSVDYSTTEIIQTSGRWIIAQRKNLAFGVQSGLIEVSLDNSQKFTKSLSYLDANKIINAHIFRNGNILFILTDNRIFLTNYNLDFVIEKTVLDTDGNPFPIHTPQNASYPGRYFYTHKYPTEREDTDMHPIGNYCNVNYGASPVQIYYTEDFGQTLKIAYKWGVHPYHYDNGTSEGGTTGTPLGDASNPIFTRHTHFVEYCAANGKWYCCTGDGNNVDADDTHWFEGEYTSGVWNWQKLDFGFVIPSSSFLKVADGFFVGDYFYYCSDATSASESNPINGIYRVKIQDLTDVDKHEKIVSFPVYNQTASAMKVNAAGIIAFTLISSGIGDGKTDTIGFVKDFGEGEAQYKTFPGMNFIRMNSENEKGFFRLDTDRFTTLQNKSFLIKAGFDLFNNI